MEIEKIKEGLEFRVMLDLTEAKWLKEEIGFWRERIREDGKCLNLQVLLEEIEKILQ